MIRIVDTQCFEKALKTPGFEKFTLGYFATDELAEELDYSLVYAGRPNTKLDQAIALNMVWYKDKDIKHLYYKKYIEYLRKYPIQFRAVRGLADLSILAIVSTIINHGLFPARQLTVFTEDNGLIKKIGREKPEQEISITGLRGLLKDERNHKIKNEVNKPKSIDSGKITMRERQLSIGV